MTRFVCCYTMMSCCSLVDNRATASRPFFKQPAHGKSNLASTNVSAANRQLENKAILFFLLVLCVISIARIRFSTYAVRGRKYLYLASRMKSCFFFFADCIPQRRRVCAKVTAEHRFPHLSSDHQSTFFLYVYTRIS